MPKMTSGKEARMSEPRISANLPGVIQASIDRGPLVVMSINTMTFAAMDFGWRLGASDEHIPSGSVRSEQQRLRPKDVPPPGLRRIWPVASLLGRSSIAADTLSPSRLATGQIRRNERHRIYAHDHLVTT